MSSQYELLDPLTVSSYSEDVLLDIDYKHQILRRVVQFVGLFYLVYGIFVTYIWTSKSLDRNVHNSSIEFYFCDPIIATYSLCNVAVFAAIIVNKYWIIRDISCKFIAKPDINVIAFSMLIPLFLSSSVFKILQLLREISIIPCHGFLDFLEPLSSMTLIIGTAILIFDIKYYSKGCNNWIENLVKSNLIFFTMIGVTNCLVITVAIQHMKIFRTESVNSSYKDWFIGNDSCIENGKISSQLNYIHDIADKYLRPTYVLFCICTLAYLVQLILDEDSSTKGVELEQVFQTSSPEDSDDNSLIDADLLNKKYVYEPQVGSDERVSYRLPAASLVLCITFLSLSLLSFIIMFSLRQKDSQPWHKHLGSLIYCCFISIIYVIGSGLAAVHIVEIKRWPSCSEPRGNIIDKCLIWTGAGGQISQALTSISKSFVFLAMGVTEPIFTALLYMLILSSVLVIAQTCLQTIQISLFLNRKWIRPEINSWAESLCPAVGMMGFNIGLLLLSLDHLTSPILMDNTGQMFIDLFVSTLTSVGETVGILQRLHASLLFASMIIYTHN